MKPDYLKIIFVGIPAGFIAWCILIFPSAYIARFFNVGEYWFHISLFLTLILMFVYFIFCIKHPIKAGAAIITDPKYLEPRKEEYHCEICGNKIDRIIKARIWHGSIFSRNSICCQNCHDKKAYGSYRITIFIILFQVCFGIIFIALNPEDTSGWILINLSLITFFSILMLLPHECGHVLTARILGEKVPFVFIGMGKTVFIAKFSNICWEFRNIPFGGTTVSLITNHFKYRRNRFLITLGGPLINLIVIVCFLLYYPVDYLFTGTFTNQFAVGSAFFLANLIELGYNLLPIKVNTSAGKIPSDGYNLLSLIFMKENVVRSQVEENNMLLSQIKELSINHNIKAVSPDRRGRAT